MRPSMSGWQFGARAQKRAPGLLRPRGARWPGEGAATDLRLFSLLSALLDYAEMGGFEDEGGLDYVCGQCLDRGKFKDGIDSD